jgi:hypothetical protein
MEAQLYIYISIICYEGESKHSEEEILNKLAKMK